ncbi:MAG: radical SAM protein [Candidatus Wallbacteria bacterium]|nr:radical SAM protein [Candidatus Wallbacteria bacterium]
MTEKLKILLVQPAWESLGYRRKIKIDERKIHPLSVGVVAALCGTHAVRIIDEALERVPWTEKYDLVGISANTYTAPRAFELADRFRKLRIPVVLGGHHTSFLPDECLQHADSLVVGDAEDTWPQLLEDFQAGGMKQRYTSGFDQSGKSIPSPRRDLFFRTKRTAAYCQVSRGCDNRCRFCYLQYLPCKKMRYRDPEEVRRELLTIQEEIILFVDDNLFCDRKYCLDFFKLITPLKKKWWIQAPTSLHSDDELISAMAASGCFSVSIGFQTSTNLNNQNESIYQNNTDNYQKLVKLLHKHVILVDGTFIFGFDGDTKNIFKNTGRLIRRIGLDTYTFYFLTPYPGTDYYSSLKAEGRLIENSTARFDWDHVVVKPEKMTENELRLGVKRLYRNLDMRYYLQSAIRRFKMYRRVFTTWSLFKFLLSLSRNYLSSQIDPD